MRRDRPGAGPAILIAYKVRDMMEGMSALEIVEVGPRDGLQNEDVVLDVAARVAVPRDVRTLAGAVRSVTDAPLRCATEDLLYALGRSGIGTGIEMAALLIASAYVEQRLGHANPALLGRAGMFPALRSSLVRAAEQC